ncbi:TlpA family protein disulfide reductase [Hymenobacter sp. IS2118]|uniref:TlpA family protein disulfide reductase n=1 Tax=Hymenobacter sp. IS2118 TaxID=1505605 RepID=UPI0005571CA5|nr:TlpA disulfide reductase family protein [Hymenobacter sp. IS2118]
MISAFTISVRRLLGTVLLVVPVLAHGQTKPVPAGTGKTAATTPTRKSTSADQPATKTAKRKSAADISAERRRKASAPVAEKAPKAEPVPVSVEQTAVVAEPAPAKVAAAKPAPAPAKAAPMKPFMAPITGTATLSGRVSGSTTDSVGVSLRENPLDPTERVIRVALGEKGDFKLVIPVRGSTKADLVYGDDVAPLYLDAGTDMDVRFKGDDMAGTLRFKPNDVSTGLATKFRNRANLTDEQKHRQQAANANNYLVEADAQFVENDGFQVLPDNIQLYEAPFLSFLEYRRKHQLEFLEDHSAKQSFTQDFYNYAHAEVVYAYANDRLTFQDLREQVVNTESRLKMDPSYYNFLREPGLLNEPNAAQSELYHEFLLNYVHFTVAQDKRQRSDPDFYPASYALASKKLAGPTRPIILGRILQESFRFGHVRQSAAMLADFRTYDPKNMYYSTLESDFNRHKDFAIGAPAPDFKLATASGDTVNLHDYVGKLVYLNFWKTTNGLCLRDLAYAQELIRKFEGKNITFINIALDENEQAWRQLVTVKKLPGVQVRVPGGGLRSPLASAYALQDVPTYMLVGEDGTFLNTKPKRLSSRAAIDEINQSFGKASTYTSAIEFTDTKK